MNHKTLAYQLASTGDALARCQAKVKANPADLNAAEWAQRHTAQLARLAREYLPSGAGLDNGCKVLSASMDKIVIETSFHHMDESGTYAGWSEHVITVSADLGGLKLRIGGKNRNEIKDYLHETFVCALETEVLDKEIAHYAAQRAS